MSEARSVFAVDRGVFDHPVFAREPYTEREAWLWLLSQAAWRPHRVRVRNGTLELRRGQCAFATRFMAQKWDWSEARVRRFLTRLKIDAMIDAQGDARTTLITICNYDVYQKVSLPSDAQGDAENDAHATRTRRKEEDKENREDTSSLRSEVDPAFDEYDTAASESGWPSIRKRDPDRRAKMLRLLDRWGASGWREGLAKARGSPFLCGENDRGWKANIDFFLQPNKFRKLMEGGYDGRSKSPRQSTAERGVASLGRVFEQMASPPTGDDPDAGTSDAGGGPLPRIAGPPHQQAR